MKKTSLGLIFLVVFTDVVGFGLILPLLPLYADNHGAGATYIALMISVYSLMQFVFNPIWGGLSDKVGRRPIMLFSLAGSTLSYVLYGAAEQVASTSGGVLAVLFFSRAMAGLMGANISTAQAYVADVTTPEKRAQGMGAVGAAIGLGFVLGPAIGALFTANTLLAGLGMGAVGYLAAAINGLNLVGAWFFLGEPKRDVQVEKAGKKGRWELVMSNKGLLLVVLINFFLVLSFTQMEVSLSLLGRNQFGFSISDIGMVFAYVGLVVVLMQGGATRPLVRRFGEEKVLMLGALSLFLGMALVSMLGPLPLVLAGLGFIGVGMGLSQPSLWALLSKKSPPGRQGVVMGVGQSVSSLARITGPFVGLNLFGFVSMGAPYLFGAVTMAGVSLLVLMIVKNSGQTAR